ncbi:MAG: SDR family NAD(P)-dependent oxidoreductase [Bacteroidales bacterium]|nr:SDR family NAD(P)-dependent oxidoreductase [Bacteroidales bacterium]
MKKIALITGATAGIGKATAYKLAENNYDLIITGRRKDRLTDIKNSISNKYKSDVLILNFDIRNKQEVDKTIDTLPEKWKNIDILINNAGLAAGLNTIQEGNIDNWEKMIDTNIKGLLYISRKIAPLMIKRKSGHIVNISSIAGKEVYPNGNVYCATKHAVDALTKAMRIDMLNDGIKVTSIAPGMIETEFSLVRFDWDEKKAKSVYNGLTPLYADDIAEAILFVITRPSHVNINDMLIMPTAQACATIVKRENI